MQQRSHEKNKSANEPISLSVDELVSVNGGDGLKQQAVNYARETPKDTRVSGPAPFGRMTTIPRRRVPGAVYHGTPEGLRLSALPRHLRGRRDHQMLPGF
jgi:hypothetical protein